MVRYDNTIYHDTPPDKNARYKTSAEFRRPRKTSSKRAEHRRRIATNKMIMHYAGGPNAPDDVREQCNRNIAFNERKLSMLQKDQSHKIKRTYKKRTLEEIKKYTLAWIDGAKASGETSVTAEDIAFQLNVKPHFVKQVLQQLNVEGIVYQKRNVVPHDSKRDLWGGTDSSWAASRYYFRYQEGDED